MRKYPGPTTSPEVVAFDAASISRLAWLREADLPYARADHRRNDEWRRRDDSRDRRQPSLHALRDVREHLCARVARPVGRERDGQHVLAVEADVVALQTTEAARQQRRAGEHHERQRYLRRDERLSNEPAPSRFVPRSSAQAER